MWVLGIDWLSAEVVVVAGLLLVAFLLLGWLRSNDSDDTSTENQSRRSFHAKGQSAVVGGTFGARLPGKQRLTDAPVTTSVDERKAYAESLIQQGDIQRAVPMLAELGEYRRAAEVMEDAKHWLQAGMLYQQANRYSLAIRCFERSTEPERAAPLLKEAGEHKRALLLEAEAARRQERLDEAASTFYQAGAYEQAGALYLELNDLERCVESYRRAGQVGVAAQLLESNDNWEWAAALYEEGEQWEAASRAYEKANQVDNQVRVLVRWGRVCEAANILHKERRFEDSLPLLEKVSVMNPQYSRACWMRGRVLESLGKLTKASVAYVEALKDVDVRLSNVPQFIRVARVQEGAGLLAEAVATVSRVIVAGHASRKETEWAKEMSRLYLGAMRRQDMDPAIANSPTMAPEITDVEIGRKLSVTKEWISARPKASKSTTQKPTPPDLGRRYKVGTILGQGGNGVVYGGYDRILQKDVAIKLVAVREGRSQDSHDAFVHEVQVAAKLVHENIVTIYDVGAAKNFLFFTMEQIRGKSMSELIHDRQQSLSHERFLPMIVQLCDALNYAHDRQIVHRDIKPGNVMVDRNDQIKLLDFGIATALDEVSGQGFGVCGTPHYMSPEQIMMDYIDHRTDIYSLGCLLYSVYTGDVPYPEGNVYVQHQEAPIPDPRDRVSALSDGVATVLMRCLAKDRDERYQRASDVAEALTAA